LRWSSCRSSTDMGRAGTACGTGGRCWSRTRAASSAGPSWPDGREVNAGPGWGFVLWPRYRWWPGGGPGGAGPVSVSVDHAGLDPDRSGHRRAVHRVAASYLVMAADRDTWHAAWDRAEHASTHDELTGLPGRGLLVDRLDHAIVAGNRRSGAVVVLFLDIDAFKAVKDVHGHAVGDATLVEVAHRLGASLRVNDTLARLSGDEFVIICEDLDAGTRAPARLDHQPGGADPARPASRRAARGDRDRRHGQHRGRDHHRGLHRRILDRPGRPGHVRGQAQRRRTPGDQQHRPPTHTRRLRCRPGKTA
jgi:GGDEF domain-containing protein